jgi:hypothetical protein
VTPIKDIQANHMPVFQVRFGEKVNNRPAKLNGKLRITSANQGVVQAFVDTYGGSVQKWEEGWEAYLPRADLPIMVLPGQSIQQHWELYKGGTCARRCDGETESISGKPCMCPPDVAVRQGDRNSCSAMTRLSFLCPEVAVLGAGTLVTHGMIAAQTLPQSVAVAEVALKRGEQVPAVLRAVQKVGANRQYVVPQIEIMGTSLNELMAGSASSYGALANNRSTEVGHPPLPATSTTGGVESKRALGALSGSSPKRSVESPQPASSTGAFASTAQRTAVQKKAQRMGILDEDLEALVLDLTGKYLDEPDFTVAHINQVLDALSQKEDS